MKRLATSLLVTGAIFALAVLIAPMIGSEWFDVRRALAGESPYREILFTVRLPRILLAALAGGALAVSGLLFQALIRDSLADPYTIGVSNGASLGAVLALCFRWPIGPVSMLGAFSALVLVRSIASRAGRMSSFTLLLAGVTINSLAIAMVLFLNSMADYSQSFQIVRWLAGGIESPEYSTLLLLTAIVLPVSGYVWFRSRDWNLLAVGEQWAEARGVSASRLLNIGLLLGSLLTASVTCLTGPIGFLGWSIPHILRLRLGADHRLLIPNAFLLGGAFLVVCDTAARTATAPAEIPVGAITSLLAGPFFLFLLSSRKRSLWL